MAVDRTIAFVDLAGFTALTEAHGDDAAVDVLDMFTAAAIEIVADIGAKPVKTIGDAVMLVPLTRASGSRPFGACSRRATPAPPCRNHVAACTTEPLLIATVTTSAPLSTSPPVAADRATWWRQVPKVGGAMASGDGRDGLGDDLAHGAAHNVAVQGTVKLPRTKFTAPVRVQDAARNITIPCSDPNGLSLVADLKDDVSLWVWR